MEERNITFNMYGDMFWGCERQLYNKNESK